MKYMYTRTFSRDQMIFRLGFGPRIRLTHKIKINSLLSAESRIFLGGTGPEQRPEKKEFLIKRLELK